MYQCIRTHKLTKLNMSPFGLHKLWPTLVHVHIATEVLVTLHPGATGLRFMIKVWLVTLIGLTNSLSTSNISEMMRKRVCIPGLVSSDILVHL